MKIIFPHVGWVIEYWCRQHCLVCPITADGVSHITSLSRLMQTMAKIINVIRVYQIQLPLDKDILKRHNFFFHIKLFYELFSIASMSFHIWYNWYKHRRNSVTAKSLKYKIQYSYTLIPNIISKFLIYIFQKTRIKNDGNQFMYLYIIMHIYSLINK